MNPAFRCALASALLLGCSDGRAVDPAPQTTASAPLPSATTETTPSAPAEAPVPIGYDALPPAASDAAQNIHFKALQDHKAKKWEAAKNGFEEAVRLAPGLVIARYNLACARARTGDVAGAASLLRDLFVLDLPQFQGRFEKDEDLETVRASPEGQKLRDLAASLLPRWRDEIAHGFPAVLWRGHNAQSGALINSFYRQGLYLPKTRRFLPLGPAPRAGQMLGALLDLERGEVVIAQGERSLQCLVDFCPRISWAKVERHPLWGDSPAPVKWQPEDDGSHIWRVDIALSDGDFLVRTVTRYPVWQRVGRDGTAKSDPKAAPSGPVLSFSESGTLYARAAPDHPVKGHALVLPDGTKIPIDAEHWDGMSHAVTLSPDRSFAVVSSSVSECECDKGERSLLQHVVSRVDLQSKTSVVLSKAKSSAAATIDQDGTIFLQIGSKMFTLSPASDPTARQPVLEGVLIAPPDTGPSNCCGL